MLETNCTMEEGSRKTWISQREGEKRDIAGEAWRTAHFCGASGERSFILPCSGDCGDH